MTQQTTFVRYKGNKEYEIDIHFGTGTIWNGDGDIQPVPADVAEKLVKNYPGTWEEVTPNQALKAKQGAVAALQQLDNLENKQAELAQAEAQAKAQKQQAAGQAKKKKAKAPEAPAPVEPEVPAEPEAPAPAEPEVPTAGDNFED